MAISRWCIAGLMPTECPVWGVGGGSLSLLLNISGSRCAYGLYFVSCFKKSLSYTHTGVKAFLPGMLSWESHTFITFL